jgi:prepilin-type N-terminal cleavage/methylation domain-containing protein
VLQQANPIQDQGFTLIELLVVIAIIGLVTALAMTQLGAAAREEDAGGFARQVFVLLSQARMTATVGGTTARVNFTKDDVTGERQVPLDGGGMTWEPSGTVARGGAGTRIVRVEAGTATGATTNPNPAEQTNPTTPVVFNPDGSVLLAGTATGVTIYVGDQTNTKKWTIAVYGATGFSRMIEGW